MIDAIFDESVEILRELLPGFAERLNIDSKTVNSRLDLTFGFEQHFIRGRNKMTMRAGLALYVMLAMAIHIEPLVVVPANGSANQGVTPSKRAWQAKKIELQKTYGGGRNFFLRKQDSCGE